MKKLLLSLTFVAFALIANATVHVNMYATPVTITGTHGSTNSHYIDAENDGIEDLRVYVQDYNGDFRIYVESLNNQELEAEYINADEGIAYQCGASFGAGAGWYYYSHLADADEDFQYDGRGVRYLAIRKEIATDFYVYGWLKLECASDASQFTVYGFAYNDEPEYFPNISAGEGECINATGLNDFYLPANAVTVHGRELTINFPQFLSVRLFDVAGKKLMEYQFDGGSNKFYLPQLTGLYLMEVSDGIKTKTMKLRL